MASDRSQLSARQVADLPELAAYCSVLNRHVADGSDEVELRVVRRILVAKSIHLQLGASMIVGAIELIGCPSLQRHGAHHRECVDRYTAALADLLRDFLTKSA
jgi:hypothetical protein